MSRRNRYDIFQDILDACTKEQTLSSILRKCGISWNQKELIFHLNHCGFLKKQGQSFKTTNEGRVFLREFEELLSKLDT